jgi:hypothetical protein
MGALSGLAAAGEEGPTVWTKEEAVGCCTFPPIILSLLFPLPEVRFCWDLDLLRGWAPTHLLPSLLGCLVGWQGIPL